MQATTLPNVAAANESERESGAADLACRGESFRRVWLVSAGKALVRQNRERAARGPGRCGPSGPVPAPAKEANSSGVVRVIPSEMVRLRTRKNRKRRIDPERLERAFSARQQGATLRQSAAAAGVHVATLCRWQNREPWIKKVLRQAEAFARRRYYASKPHRRPRVPWRKDCPLCGSAVVVRTGFAFRFWRCSTWPACLFASWRPRAPADCPGCNGPRFWSHSRKSIACPCCGSRQKCE